MADPITEGQDTNVVSAALSKVGFRESLELLSKGWVFLLAAIYASGYIVVSIYHASLGLNEINPLRPKVAAAGLLFLALGLGANYIQRYVDGLFKDSSSYESESQRHILRTFGGALGIYCFDVFGANAVSLMMRFDMPSNYDLSFSALWILGMLLSLASAGAGKNRPRLLRLSTHSLFTFVCLIMLTALVAMSVLRHGEFGAQQFALYLASVQIAIRIATRFPVQLKPWERGQWSAITGFMLLPLLLFGIWVYPHTTAAFGGGEPTTAEISILPNTSGGTPTTVSIKIIDETDAGFYVIEANDSRVKYIPRNLVTSVSFDKPKGWY
jgi:hypothetical protein